MQNQASRSLVIEGLCLISWRHFFRELERCAQMMRAANASDSLGGWRSRLRDASAALIRRCRL
jgi:hypothetical protein